MGTSKMKIFDSSILFFLLRHTCAKGISTMYEGECFVDSGSPRRIWQAEWADKVYINSNQVEPKMCERFCREKGYKYYGLQATDWCHCGDKDPNPRLIVDNADCRVPCKGDKSAICGGHWRMNIFTIQESGGKRYIPSDKSVKITQIGDSHPLYPLRNAFDGNDHTMWHSREDLVTYDKGIIFDFGKNIQLKRMHIVTRKNCCRQRYRQVCLYADDKKVACTPGKPFIPGNDIYLLQDHRLAGMNDIIMGRMIKLVFEANENLQIMELDVRYDEPDQAYVVGRDGCWSDSDCDRAILINGDGQCSACDGPLGQTGFCCRGDGYHSGCSEKLKRQITLNGFSGHACIYMLGNAQVRYPSKSDGNAYIARQVKWCILSDLSAGVCADQLVDNLKHDFDGNWGCMVTIGDGHASGYYYHLHNKYSVYCFPYSSTSMKRR